VVDIEAEEESSFIIDAKLISKVVKSLPEGEIEINYNGNTVEIKANKSRFNLNTIRGDEFPDFQPASDTGYKVTLSVNKIKNMIDKVIFCAATDKYMRNLNGVLWQFNGPNLRLVAADGFKLGYIDREIESDEEFSFLLSLKSMKELQKILDSCDYYITVVFDGAKVGFQSDNTQVIVRVIEAEFPDYEKVIPTKYKTQVIVNKYGLLEAIKRAAITARLSDERVEFKIFDNILHIESKSQDYGEAHEELEIQKFGEDIAIAFNPRFITEAVQQIEGEDVELTFIDPTKPVQINSLIDPRYLYVVMPLRK